MKYVYPTIFEDDDGKIGVTVPDIPHCHTFGDNMADAIEMAKDCIEMMLASYEDDGQAIPPASKINKIKTRGTVSYILVDTDEWRKEFDGRAIKKTLSIPAWLNTKAERASVNFSQTLQDALCQKLGIARSIFVVAQLHGYTDRETLFPSCRIFPQNPKQRRFHLLSHL